MMCIVSKIAPLSIEQEHGGGSSVMSLKHHKDDVQLPWPSKGRDAFHAV